MRLRLVAISAAVVIAATAACGSSGGSSSGSTPTAAATSTTSAKPESTPIPDVKAVAARGANAAPVADRSIPYVKGQDAATAFSEWWRYEIQLIQDQNKGVQQAYYDGISVCGSRNEGAGPEAILTVLHRDLGWTKTGAAAVYAAALRALCPQFDFGQATSDGTINGYKTYFDEQVNLSYPLVIQAVRPFGLRNQPNHIDVGWLGKYTCNYLKQAGTSIGLLDHLQTEGRWLALASEGPALAQASAKQVVTNMCPSGMGAVLTW